MSGFYLINLIRILIISSSIFIFNYISGYFLSVIFSTLFFLGLTFVIERFFFTLNNEVLHGEIELEYFYFMMKFMPKKKYKELFYSLVNSRIKTIWNLIEIDSVQKYRKERLDNSLKIIFVCFSKLNKKDQLSAIKDLKDHKDFLERNANNFKSVLSDYDYLIKSLELQKR